MVRAAEDKGVTLVIENIQNVRPEGKRQGRMSVQARMRRKMPWRMTRKRQCEKPAPKPSNAMPAR